MFSTWLANSQLWNICESYQLNSWPEFWHDIKRRDIIMLIWENHINVMTSWCPNTKCGNTTKTIYGAASRLREANFQIDKEEISTKTARKGFWNILTYLWKKKVKIFCKDNALISQVRQNSIRLKFGTRSAQLRHSLSHHATLKRHWFTRPYAHVPNLNQLLLVGPILN
jgi:hypothetical protein